MSSGTRLRPRRRHSSASSCATWSSTAKWTTRRSSGVRLRAYWMARAVAMSSRSMNTSTTCRRRIGALMAAGTSLSSSTASRVYCLFSRSNATTSNGSSARITQAPSANLVMAMIKATMKERKAPKPLMATPLRQPGWRSSQVVLGHPGLGQREAGEDTDRVEGDQCRDLGAGGDHEHDGGAGEDEDAVRVDEAVAALGHLAGEEAVAGLEGREPGEVGEAGVGRHDQDQHRAGLQREVEDGPEGAGAVDRHRRSGR